MPAGTLLSLEVRSPSFHGFLVVGASRGARGIGLVDDRPRGLPATGFVRRLRNELEGSRILRAHTPGSAVVRLDCVRGQDERALVVEPADRDGSLLLVLDGQNVLLAAFPARALPDRGLAIGDVWVELAAPVAPGIATTLESLRTAGLALLEAHTARSLARRLAALDRALVARSHGSIAGSRRSRVITLGSRALPSCESTDACCSRACTRSREAPERRP